MTGMLVASSEAAAGGRDESKEFDVKDFSFIICFGSAAPSNNGCVICDNNNWGGGGGGGGIMPIPYIIDWEIKKSPIWGPVYQKLNDLPEFKHLLSSFSLRRAAKVEFVLGDKDSWEAHRVSKYFTHPFSGKLKCKSICDENSKTKNINRAAKLIVDVMLFNINASLLDLLIYEAADDLQAIISKTRNYAFNNPNSHDNELYFDISETFLEYFAANPEFEYFQTEVGYKDVPTEWNLYANMLAKTYTNGNSPPTEKYLLKMAQMLKDFHGGNHSLGTYRALIWEQLMYTNVFKNLSKYRKEGIRGVLDFIRNSPDFN